MDLCVNCKKTLNEQYFSKIMQTSDIIKLAKNHTPASIRLYLIFNKKHYLINNGSIKYGFSNNLKLSKNRTSVLESFSKMGFLFDELIRLRIVGYIHDSSSKELLYLLNLIPINRKIRTFLDWKVFDPKFTKRMSRLFEVRNDVMHSITLNEVDYIPGKTMSMETIVGFNKFKKDMVSSWSELIQIYNSQQAKIDLHQLSRDLLL